MKKPHLTFFCELESPELEALFNTQGLIDTLKDLEAGISLGILDLSPQRAHIVQRLNQAEIPVTAWLLLPKEQGYWFNLDNFEQARERYSQFKAWTQEFGLVWKAVGLDIEPDIRFLDNMRQNPMRGYWYLLRRAFNRERGQQGRQAYQLLANQIRRDGFFVESYQIPFIVDERRAESTLLQRLLGVVDLKVDREVLMLYTSFVRPHGEGYLWSYGFDAQAIGVGSTGGGVNLEGIANTRPLNWPELHRDLLLAFQHTDYLYIFSLEGCVQQDFLPLIAQMNWEQKPHIPVQSARDIERWRRLAYYGLWVANRPWVPAFVLLTLLLAWNRRQHKR